MTLPCLSSETSYVHESNDKQTSLRATRLPNCSLMAQRTDDTRLWLMGRLRWVSDDRQYELFVFVLFMELLQTTYALYLFRNSGFSYQKGIFFIWTEDSFLHNIKYYIN